MATGFFKNWAAICALTIEELRYLLTKTTDVTELRKYAEYLPGCFMEFSNLIRVPVSALYRRGWEMYVEEAQVPAGLSVAWKPSEGWSEKFQRAMIGLAEDAAQNLGLTVISLSENLGTLDLSMFQQLGGKVWNHGLTVEYEGAVYVVIFWSEAPTEIGRPAASLEPSLKDEKGGGEALLVLVPADQLDLNA